MKNCTNRHNILPIMFNLIAVIICMQFCHTVWMTHRAFQQDQFTFPWTSKALLMCHCIMIITRLEVYKTVFSLKIYDKVLIFERLLDIDQLVISRLLLVHKMCVYLTDCTVCPCIVFRQEVSRDRLRPAKVSGRSGNNRK